MCGYQCHIPCQETFDPGSVWNEYKPVTKHNVPSLLKHQNKRRKNFPLYSRLKYNDINQDSNYVTKFEMQKKRLYYIYLMIGERSQNHIFELNKYRMYV